jgi:hypothetical protein
MNLPGLFASHFACARGSGILVPVSRCAKQGYREGRETSSRSTSPHEGLAAAG